jgi:hypothetical protein
MGRNPLCVQNDDIDSFPTAVLNGIGSILITSTRSIGSFVTQTLAPPSARLDEAGGSTQTRTHEQNGRRQSCHNSERFSRKGNTESVLDGGGKTCVREHTLVRKGKSLMSQG